MALISKTNLAAAALGAVFGAPIATIAYRAVVTPASAGAVQLPRTLRWLDEGGDREHRYSLDTLTVYGANAAMHGVICEHDGSAPRKDGVLVAPDPGIIKLCSDVAILGNTIDTDLDVIAGLLVQPSVPADMATPLDMATVGLE